MPTEPPNFNLQNPFGPRTANLNEPVKPPTVASPPQTAPVVQALPGPTASSEAPFWKSYKFGLLGSFAVALLPPGYWAVTSSAFQATGVGGFIGLWLSVASLAASFSRFTLYRDQRRSLILPAVAAGAGVLSLVWAGFLAHRLRAEADTIALSNQIYEPGMREFLIAEAHGNGRLCALIALIGLPGALLGGFLLALVLGARRGAKDSALGEAPVWVMLVLTAVGLSVGLVASTWAAVLPVEQAKNPRVTRVIAVTKAFTADDMRTACAELEVVVTPSFVPTDVLERELPMRAELAHRCITLHIDALPLGHACGPASEKLLLTETVTLAKAQERVRQACKGR